MTQEKLIVHWKLFVKDLFLGTFTRVVICGFTGFGFGSIFLGLFKNNKLEPLDLNIWLEWPILSMFIFWFLGWGTFHGLGGAIVYTLQKKISEMVSGIQGLFDLLSKQALGSISKIHRVFTKDEIAEKFDSFGKDFQANLKLKGVGGWLSSFFFTFILRTLKFMFLDEIAETLLKKPGDKITSADIESAIRRVGVDTLISPIVDQFILLHCLNFVLMALSFSLPFFIFWLI